MVCFKGLQQDGGLYLSIVDMEDALAESVRLFLSPFFAQVPTIKLSSFAQRFFIRVERTADDGSEVC